MTTKRTTVYFDGDLHQALRAKAVATSQSVSTLVNAAVREALAEDSEDLDAFASRVGEADLPFEDVLAAIGRAAE